MAHILGIPCDIRAIEDIANDRKIFLIDDSAQALGAEYHGKKTGSFGNAGFLSFARGKPFTILDGGALLTNDDDLYKSCRELASQYHHHYLKMFLK